MKDGVYCSICGCLINDDNVLDADIYDDIVSTCDYLGVCALTEIEQFVVNGHVCQICYEM